MAEIPHRFLHLPYDDTDDATITKQNSISALLVTIKSAVRLTCSVWGNLEKGARIEQQTLRRHKRNPPNLLE